MSPLQARLESLERKTASADRAVRALQRGVADLNQGIWESWNESVGVGLGETPPSGMCLAGYSCSSINGACGFTYLIGQTVTLQDNATHAVLGTTTISALGGFSGSVMIASPTQVVDFIVSVTGYATSTTTVTLSCGSNTLPAIALSLDTGYHCLPGCTQPTNLTTLYTHDSIFGSQTLTLAGSTWSLCFSHAYAGSATPSCASQTSIPVIYQVNSSGFTVKYVGVGANNCPQPGSCISSTFNIILFSAITTTNCTPGSFAAHAVFGTGNGGAPLFGDIFHLPVTINIADTPI